MLKQTSFSSRVLDVVKRIPIGKVLSYKQVAAMVGNPNASRAVGNIMAANKDKNVPCHRVIRSDGAVGAYNGLRSKGKEEILRKEGYVSR